MPRRAITLLVNPAAGGLLDGSISPEHIVARLSDAGFDVDLLSGSPSEILQRAQQALRLPSEVVVVAGGDGTINAAAQALAGSGKTLAILPAGTLNHLTRDLGIPPDLDDAVDVILDGEAVDIDVGEVNGHLFLCSSVIGFASRLGSQREKWRGRLGAWTWARLLTRAARTLYRDPRLEVRFEGSTQPPLRTRYLMVAVGGYEEVLGRPLSRSRLDRGEFGVYAVRQPTLARILRIFVAVLAGRWRRTPDLIITEARELTVNGRRTRLRVMNDGEVALLEPPLRYVVRTGGLRVLRRRAASTEQDEPTPTAAHA